MTDNITMDVSGGGSGNVTLDVTPGESTGITMATEATGGGSDGPYARKAEAWAVGKRNGVDVPSTDETYHNNSKYWAENASFLRAQLAVMVGNLEGLDEEWEADKEQYLSEAAEANASMNALYQTMIAAGLRELNGPNLIKKQNFYTSRDMPSSAVISETLNIPAETAAEAAENLTFTVSNNAITSSYKLHGIKAANSTIVPWNSVSATFAAGAATITITARNGSAAHAATTVDVYLCTTSAQNVVYGNASRIGGSTYPYMRSIQSGNYPGDDSVDGIYCTVVQKKPNAYSTSSAYAVGAKCVRNELEYQCNTAIASGGEAWNANHWTLIDPEWVQELDGAEYPMAIQYNITAFQSGYLNAEFLHYCESQNYRTYTQGATNITNYGQIEEMTPGKRYTVSCWVKVISGTGVLVRFGYGGRYSTSYPMDDATTHLSGISDPIELTANNGAWQRVYWSFEFNPTGNWYTETSETANNVTTITRTYNWQKKVMFGVCRKYTAVVQMCGFRVVEGDMWLPSLGAVIDDIAALHQRQTNLENVQLELFGAAGNSF